MSAVMKKKYMAPAMTLVRIQHASLICQSITTMESNVELHYRGGSSTEESRVKLNNYNVWDDDWSE